MYVKRLSIGKIPSSMYAFSFIRVFPRRSVNALKLKEQVYR